MPAYSGKYQYLEASGETIDQGSCQLGFEDGGCIVTPLAFGLGDADRATPAEWDLQLALYTGRTVVLKQLGAAFSRMSEELLAAWRDRTVECLLLEDLEEVARYQGAAVGARKLPDLRALRAAYRGRAIHSSLEVWSAQVAEAIK